jgi:Mrp family chromosome partitioning ATPase
MNEETTDAGAMFAPLWRYRWLMIVVVALAAVGSYLYYNHQAQVYRASTQLYLGSGSETQQPGVVAQPKASLTDRAVADQAALINSNVVGEPVRARLRGEHRLAAADGSAHAKSSTGSDFIAISTQARTSQGAAELANAYARVYIAQRYAGYRREIKAAIAGARQQLRRIESGAQQSPRGAGRGTGRGATSTGAAGSSGLVAAASLVSRIDQLESELSVAGVEQISPAKPPAFAASPRPKRDALFGVLLGLLLAAVLAYALSRFDRLLRTPQDIEAVYQTEVLAALPSAKSPLVRQADGPAPAEAVSEPLRRLDTMIRLTKTLGGAGEFSPRTLLFLSADPDDGKSTLVAGLALAAREAGERVAVIDADLRQPAQAQLLGVNAQYGLAEVLAGTLGVEDALQPVEPPDPRGAAPNGAGSLSAGAGTTTMLAASRASSLSVLVGGGPLANPSALFAGPAMSGLLASLAEDFDRVLIDAPPPLAVSDAMPLFAQVDGIVIVARAGHTRRASAERLTALLRRTTSAPVLGVVANAVPAADIQGYGFYPAQRRRGPLSRLVGR